MLAVVINKVLHPFPQTRVYWSPAQSEGFWANQSEVEAPGSPGWFPSRGYTRGRRGRPRGGPGSPGGRGGAGRAALGFPLAAGGVRATPVSGGRTSTPAPARGGAATWWGPGVGPRCSCACCSRRHVRPRGARGGGCRVAGAGRRAAGGGGAPALGL